MLYVLRTGGKFGYVNFRGETIVAPHYKDVGTFSEGKGWLIDFNDNGFIVNGEGAIVYELGHVEELGPCFSGGVLSFARKGKFGFFDQFGRTVVAPTFDRVGPCIDGIVMVSIPRKICS